MLSQPMDVLEQFPVRKSNKQKQAFRDAVQSYAQSLGYTVTTESKGRENNVVIGNPDTAKYLVTAHYDTCARLPFPNLITPCNPLTFILYQLLVVMLFFAVSIVVGVAVGLGVKNAEIAYYCGYLTYWGLLLLMLFGPANKHNANDNTSGVVTLLEIVRTLPESHRDKVCFVLFDLEEAGLVGSAAYRKAHKKETQSQLVLNLDCVGDGNELMMFPTKKLKKDSEKMQSLAQVCGDFGEKSLNLHKDGFSAYPSDQKNFPYGVGIAAFRRKKGVGLYCSRIHTNRDTILEEENVKILRDQLTALIMAD